MKPTIVKVYKASNGDTCATLEEWKQRESQLLLVGSIEKHGVIAADSPIAKLTAEFIVKESDAFIAILKVKERAQRGTKKAKKVSVATRAAKILDDAAAEGIRKANAAHA